MNKTMYTICSRGVVITVMINPISNILRIKGKNHNNGMVFYENNNAVNRDIFEAIDMLK